MLAMKEHTKKDLFMIKFCLLMTYWGESYDSYFKQAHTNPNAISKICARLCMSHDLNGVALKCKESW
jgi:hypothetical protein